MQCVILAGGLATRMRPFTEHIPKSLLMAGDLPFVHYQLSWLTRHGVKEVVLCIGYKGEMIREYVKDGSRWDLSVKYVDEGSNLRGTAGALRLALEYGALEESFLLTYGDSFLPVDFREVWKGFLASHQPALMTVFRNQGKWDTSNVCYQNGTLVRYDKTRRDPSYSMEFIDYGLSALRRDLVQRYVPGEGKSDLADLFYDVSRAGLLAGFEFLPVSMR